MNLLHVIVVVLNNPVRNGFKPFLSVIKNLLIHRPRPGGVKKSKRPKGATML